MTGTSSLLYSRTAGFRAFGVSLAALEGVLAVAGGIGFAIYNYTGPGHTSLVATAGPVLVVMLGILLLRVSSAIGRATADRTKLDHVSIAAGALGQLTVAAPLLWFTLSDPVDARTNVLLTMVALMLAVSGLALSFTWLDFD